ncbi:MAG: hypothetical protein ACI4D8_06530 [Wujia sp.]
MNFQELLIDYCNRLNCTQNDLTIDSGLSAPVISRYISGERTPAVDSEQLNSLAKRLSDIALAKGMDNVDYSYNSILSTMTNALRLKEQQYSSFVTKFITLIDLFDIKIKDLAKGINFDASFLYRVRSGERRPANLDNFCDLVAFYIVDNYNSPTDIDRAASFLKCDADILSEREAYARQIRLF